MGWTSFQVSTRTRTQLADITEKVSAAVEKAGVQDGVCHVYVPQTTAGVTINEAADPDVAKDLEEHLARLVPQDAGFEHAEGNSDSHIKTTLVGPSVSAPVRGGKLSLGTWQGIFLCEWDGPRTRTVEVGVTALS
ncbi:MAG TPA: secondary thiamine-phosphate synthase enzyme YjbQ [Candidatus Dormibacteraeota bacterium]|nr:secondary thiamine-phosphate synthase enzyme YjbQ [Candidatus Dormibacteraeota bacterium]